MVKTVLWHGVRKWRVLAKQVTYGDKFNQTLTMHKEGLITS